jgi:hypothetical protein
MNIAKQIESRIHQFPEGTTFRYQELGILPKDYSAAAKAMERNIKRNMIRRVSTGVFYKPKQSVFGELKPSEEELIKPYLFKNGNRIAYVTGSSLYNRLGLSTQVPKNVKVASRSTRIIAKIGSVQVKPVKSYIDVNDSNYTYLEFLDVIKDIKQIPDSDISDIIKYIMNRLIEFNIEELEEIVNIAINYPPRVRALLGALLETTKLPVDISILKDSINPFTVYKLGVKNTLGEICLKWNLL